MKNFKNEKMKRQLKSLLSGTIVILFSVYLLNAQTPPIPGSWVKIPELTNEFDDEINSNDWNVYDPKWQGRWPSYFDPNNVKVENGKLLITGRPVDEQTDFPPYDPEHPNDPYTHVTGTLKSTTQVLYGYFEVYAKASDSKYWNSFWLYDYNDQQHTEIDIVEIVATEDYLVTTAHRFYDKPDYPPPADGSHYKDQYEFFPWDNSNDWHKFFYKGFFAEYHKYALDWNKDYITWYIDDKEIFKAENKYWHQPLNLVIDAEVSHEWPTPRPTTTEVYEIEYVRAWKNDPAAAIGDEDLNISKSIMYPNPTSGEFKLSYSSPYIGEVNINIFTIDGREIEKINLQKIRTNFIHHINLPRKGIYFIQFVAGKYQTSHKIIKN